jgi:hypothetical protein
LSSLPERSVLEVLLEQLFERCVREEWSRELFDRKATNLLGGLDDSDRYGAASKAIRKFCGEHWPAPEGGPRPQHYTWELEAEKRVAAETNAWPVFPATALYGVAGDVVRTIGPHSEADPVAILVQFMTMFGSAVGAAPWFRAEADEHHANLFVLLAGETSVGRKGTSYGQARRIFKTADETWERTRTIGGLSTGEGLIAAVQDRPDTPTDKRLLVYEPEFARVLRVMRREGNTLSTVLREAWDSRTLSVTTRKDPLLAPGAHVSISREPEGSAAAPARTPAPAQIAAPVRQEAAVAPAKAVPDHPLLSQFEQWLTSPEGQAASPKLIETNRLILSQPSLRQQRANAPIEADGDDDW